MRLGWPVSQILVRVGLCHVIFVGFDELAEISCTLA